MFKTARSGLAILGLILALGTVSFSAGKLYASRFQPVLLHNAVIVPQVYQSKIAYRLPLPLFLSKKKTLVQLTTHDCRNHCDCLRVSRLVRCTEVYVQSFYVAAKVPPSIHRITGLAPSLAFPGNTSLFHGNACVHIHIHSFVTFYIDPRELDREKKVTLCLL